MFDILCERPLPIKDDQIYRDITSDGSSYFLSVAGENKIIKTDCDRQPISAMATDRLYTCLCYDSREDCFWAAADKVSTAIFRLNPSFRETGRFSLQPFDGTITALSYCAGDDTITVAIGGAMVNFSKTPQRRFYKIKQNGPLVMGVGFICPFYLCCEQKGVQQVLTVRTQCGTFVNDFALPPQYLISSINVEREDREFYCFQLLANKQGEQCILEMQLAKGGLVPSYYHPAIAQESVSCCCDTCPPPASAEACGHHNCHHTTPPPPCPPEHCCPPPFPGCQYPGMPPFPYAPYPSMPPLQYAPYPMCFPYPPPMPAPCPPPYPFPCPPATPPCHPSQSGHHEIIQSIACVNGYVAQILHAQGQKLLQPDLTLEQLDPLLALNDSTSRIITGITHLEQTFYALLDAVLNSHCHVDEKATEQEISEKKEDKSEEEQNHQ